MSSTEYSPGPAAGARVDKTGENWTLIVERTLKHPPEKVWRAITDPDHLRQWAPYDADGSLGTAGATVTLTAVAAPAETASKTIIKLAEAPHLLEYNWGTHEMRWRLEAVEGGTRLTLWHNIDRRYIAMGAAGWQICLDILNRFLDGAPLGRIVGPDAMQHGWPQLYAEYRELFGV